MNDVKEGENHPYFLIKTKDNVRMVSKEEQLPFFINQISKDMPYRVERFRTKRSAKIDKDETLLKMKADKNYKLIIKEQKNLVDVFGLTNEKEIYTAVYNANFYGVIKGFYREKWLSENCNNSRIRFFEKTEEAFKWFNILYKNDTRKKNQQEIFFTFTDNQNVVGFVKEKKYIKNIMNIAIESEITPREENKITACNFVLRKSSHFNQTHAVIKKREILNEKINSKKVEIEKVDIYIDGSYDDDSPHASYGHTYYLKDTKFNVSGVIPDGIYRKSIGAELYSCLKALEVAITNQWHHIAIHYDCTAIKNYSEVNLLAYEINEMQRHYFYHFHRLITLGDIEVEFVKVKAHYGNKGNQLANDLAVEARNKFIYY